MCSPLALWNHQQELARTRRSVKKWNIVENFQINDVPVELLYRKVRLKHKITTGNARTILEAIFLLFILYWDRKKGDGKSSSTIVGKSHINFQQVAMEVSICTKMFVSRLSWIQKTKHIFGSTKRSCWNQCWDFLSSYLSTTTTGISGF